MKTHPQAVAGYTLIEVAVVLVVLGLMFGMSIPSFASFRRAHMLQAGSEHVLGQLRLARQKALGMQHDQRLTFTTATNSYSVEDLVTHQTFGPFTFPKEITLDQANLVEGGLTGTTIAALTDGRYSGSGEIVLRDVKGVRDTVSVQVSGLALIR
jgi:prepilin-type N-terminal cleavage/methylation domain-containing protein